MKILKPLRAGAAGADDAQRLTCGGGRGGQRYRRLSVGPMSPLSTGSKATSRGRVQRHVVRFSRVDPSTAGAAPLARKQVVVRAAGASAARRVRLANGQRLRPHRVG
jgi:hypothetical protein